MKLFEEMGSDIPQLFLIRDDGGETLEYRIDSWAGKWREPSTAPTAPAAICLAWIAWKESAEPD